MSAGIIMSALRRERADLALRWVSRFMVTQAATGHAAVAVDDAVVLALLEDFITALDPVPALTLAHSGDRSDLLGRLAGFPENITVVIDLLQAGAQVIGAFVVENAGPCGAWSVRARNRFLGELDAVFPLLVRREVAALCEHASPNRAPSPGAQEMTGLPKWARDIARRN